MTLTIILYALGSLADFFSTQWFIERGGIEANPIARVIINNLGIEWLLVGKILAIILVWLMIRYMREYKEMFYVIWAIALGQWLVVGWNVFWIRVMMEAL